MTATRDPVEHGPETVCYSNSLGGYRPMIICLCGWSLENGSCITWEEAGAEFDDHLEEAKAQGEET